MLRAAVRGLGLALATILLGFSGLGVTTFVGAQEIPDHLVRSELLEEMVFEEYPQLRAWNSRYFFEDLREVQMPEEGWRYFRETKLCLQAEGIEIIDHLAFNEIRWFEFGEGWNMRDHRAIELRGAWFVGAIAIHDKLRGRDLEETIRHELIHHFLGLTPHPLTPNIVGRCMPSLMLDDLKDKVIHAEPTRTRRAFPWKFRPLRDERMGPRSPFGDGSVGGPGEQLGPLGLPGGDWIPQDVRRP